MTFDIKKLSDAASRNYEKAWLDSAGLLEREGKRFSLRADRGRTHPVYDLVHEARGILVGMGFEELVLPMFVEEDEIYKQYGSEAALILDRLFYLAELPRPDIGISARKIETIRSIVKDFDKVDELQAMFKRYKKGEIEADDFIEIMVERLGIMPHEAAGIIEKVFPELKDLKPVPTKKTLRSHTTALWFPVLGALQGRKPLPIQLFHVGLKFRREQKLDARHLYESNTMSLVICAEAITLEDCMGVARDICKRLGFVDARFEIKTATGKYYAPGMEFEIFVRHEAHEDWLEIGDGGFYSPVSCAKYGIVHPVFNIGFGVERIAMIKTGAADIRELCYPYFYAPAGFSDADLASFVSMKEVPATSGGKALASAIVRLIEQHADDPAPCTVDGGVLDMSGVPVSVSVWEREAGVNLASKATFNEIIVKDGSITCHDTRGGEPPAGVARTGIRFLDAIANHFAAEVEATIAAGSEVTRQYKVIKKVADVNVHVDPAAMRHITDKQWKVDVRGPVFINITARRVTT